MRQAMIFEFATANRIIFGEGTAKQVGQMASGHGVVCGRLMPEVMETNIAALEEHMPGADAVARNAEIAQIVTANHWASAVDGVDWVRRLRSLLEATSLEAYGVFEDHFEDIIQKSQKARSMKGNPTQLTDQELKTVLHQAL